MASDVRTDLFSERIKTARRLHGLTQAQLAERVGVSKKTVENYEYGRVPVGDRLQALADGLEVTTDWLLYGETDNGDGKKQRTRRATGDPATTRDVAELTKRLVALERLLADVAAALDVNAQNILRLLAAAGVSAPARRARTPATRRRAAGQTKKR